MWKIYLFGAGKIGRYWLRWLRSFGVLPEGFIDNNEAMQGTYEDVSVYTPDRLKMHEFDYVAITCADEEAIRQQLMGMGIAEDKIIYGNHKLRNFFLYCVAKKDIPQDIIMLNDNAGSNQKVLFDLQNGMVLGGVESWSYELAGQLKEQGFEGAYLTTDNTIADFVDTTYPAYIFKYHECKDEHEMIELCVQSITENLPCTVVCNFPQYIFWSACIAKKRYPQQVRIIAVQHSDDQTYYEAYSLWQEYIDKCLVISSYIEDKQLSYGMRKDKMMRIGWQVSCNTVLERTWSKEKFPVQIGYAGRVTVTLKRADLLLEIVLKLRERNLQFCLNIAGTGNYSETLHQRIQEKGLSDYVNIMGYIDRKEIPDFWKKQDIMLSCSEREGHSISQSEAMAAGVVLVITDVSGARDDVTDGYNGFVVPVGDIDAIVDRISFLCQNRDELERIGKHAHETIYKRQEEMNQTAFWNKLLAEVWSY